MSLKRVLGAGDAAWLVAGNMIGAGIFVTPGFVAASLPGYWPLLAWGLGGLLALCGAAVYGELGARIPRAGGDYQYLRVAFGPVWGFITGWAAFVVSFSAAAAAMCKVSVSYAGAALAPDGGLPAVVAVAGPPAIVLLLTAVNVTGARVAGRTVLVLTSLPLAGLVGLFAFGWIGSPEAASASPLVSVAPPFSAWPLALGAAMLPVFFTYSGWNAAAYLAGELKRPGRDLPRGLVAGTTGVTLLYLLVNVVLLVVLGADLAGATTPVSDAARRMVGAGADRMLAGIIAVAVLGSANVTLMAGARIYYAMAGDALAPRALRRTNRAGVPSVALWVGGAWTALLAVVADVDELVSWATLAILLLSSLTAAALFVLRRRDPHQTPYRCPGYPVTPLVYLCASLAVAVAAAVADPLRALWGVLLVVAPVPFYLWLKKGDRP